MHLDMPANLADDHDLIAIVGAKQSESVFLFLGAQLPLRYNTRWSGPSRAGIGILQYIQPVRFIDDAGSIGRIEMRGSCRSLQLLGSKHGRAKLVDLRLKLEENILRRLLPDRRIEGWVDR